MGSFISKKKERNGLFERNSAKPKINKIKNKSYTKRDFWIIGLTIFVFILGLLLRTWRIIREGMPIAFDGYHFQRIAKQIFFDEWYDLTDITRDPPGIHFILVIAENMFGFSGQPIMWSIFIFPQILCSMQLIIYFVLVRRLTKTKTAALLAMFFITFVGIIVYRNQNGAPEAFVLGLVPFVVFYLSRYIETKNFRFMVVALLITSSIVVIHHLTTFVVIVLWHVIMLYDIFYLRAKSKANSKIAILKNTIVLISLDLFTGGFWYLVLKNYPVNFISGSLGGLFPENQPIYPTILMMVGALILISIAFTVFFYNFDKRKINFTIIISVIIATFGLFFVGLLLGAASPNFSILSTLSLGTLAIVIPPSAVIGLIYLNNNKFAASRAMRAWIFVVIAIISVTAIFPYMSSLLGRLALYIIGMAIVLSAICVYKLFSKINTRKLKAFALLGLIGCMALTMSCSYPKPEYNWGQQEIYFDAELKATEFLVTFVYAPNNSILASDCPITIDGDLRISLFVEGYSGLDATLGQNQTSWLTRTFFLEDELLYTYLTETKPTSVNAKIDYLFISRVMIVDGYISNWANYGTTMDNWIKKLPLNGTMIPFNPYLQRIYDNAIVYLLYEL